jgi:probable HAF family extracellular repeat protein
MADLGTLGGVHSFAYAINDVGQVVGQSGTGSGLVHAFMTGPDGEGMTDLGTLGGYSLAYGINDAGQVVGWSTTAAMGPAHAFITGPDGTDMTDLGTLAGDFSAASGINDAG